MGSKLILIILSYRDPILTCRFSVPIDCFIFGGAFALGSQWKSLCSFVVRGCCKSIATQHGPASTTYFQTILHFTHTLEKLATYAKKQCFCFVRGREQAEVKAHLSSSVGQALAQAGSWFSQPAAGAHAQNVLFPLMVSHWFQLKENRRGLGGEEGLLQTAWSRCGGGGDASRWVLAGGGSVTQASPQPSSGLT